MLDELIKREDVLKLLKEICNNSKFSNKENKKSANYQLFVDIEQTLFLFYDALFKYKVIIDDIYYFDEYLEQLEKLFKKLDNVADISEGINRILGTSCIKKLNLKDEKIEIVREKVLRYIYDKYISSGYFLHGYASCYRADLEEVGLVPEEYRKLYDKFEIVQDILKKHDALEIMDKDFTSREVVFTDSMTMGCYYAVNAPMYFSNLLCKNKFVTNEEEVAAYFKNNYDKCLKNISRLCVKLELSDKEKKIVLDTFNEEWQLLRKPSNLITLVAVKRKVLSKEVPFSIYEFISNCQEDTLGEAVGKLVGTRNNNISCSKVISKDELLFIELPGYQQVVKATKKKDEKTLEKNSVDFETDDEFFFSNVYGKVSILLLMGTLFITLGVMITIIMICKGM